MNMSFRSVLVGTLVCSMVWPSVSLAGVEEDLLFGENQGIFVASQQYEPLTEAPVVSNVITAEEIKRLGARTLNDVLLTLPGFSFIQDHNEYFSAERGIYASSQQKILVLRNGHRLNSRAYSEANFGPSISLDNVKRIEVMRGPGATLYGDVALTAVTNIVTLEGKDINGTQVTAGAGNNGQVKFDALYGANLENGRDLMFYASFFQSDGEKKTVDASRDYSANPRAGSEYLERFKGAYPAYDIGFDYQTGDVTLSYSHRYDHYAMPRAGGGGNGQLIDYDSIRSFEGEGAGSSSEFNHFDLQYGPKIGDYQLVVRPYFDTFTFRDNEPQRRADETATPAGSNGTVPKSYFMKWMERSYGLQGSVARNYDTSFGNGNLLVGVQGEQMDLYDSWDVHSPDKTHNEWYMPETKVLRPGKETSYAAYAQAKHRFTQELILNAGLRYDDKERLTGDPVTGFSPRAAFLYLPSEKLNFRLSYGKSFVDAPYWYRYNQMGGGYAGGETLRPEWLQTYQFTTEFNPTRHFTNTLNFFYNDFTDIIFRNAKGVYGNAGAVRTKGAELELGYRRPSLSVRANYTYQYTDEAKGYYPVKDGMTANIPEHMANLITDYAPFYTSRSHLLSNTWLNLWVRYVGERFEPFGISNTVPTRTDLNNRDGEYFLVNAGVNFENFLWDSVTLRFHVYNALDTKYVQGGSVNLPYEQPGISYLGELSYKF